MKPLWMLFVLPFSLFAAMITPHEAMQAHLGADAVITKESAMLTPAQLQAVETRSGMKLESKIVRLFSATRGGKEVAKGVLLSRLMRTKNAVILYLFTPDLTLKAAEAVAFNEPPEYLPSDAWFDQFDDANRSRELRMGKDVTAITGATLSARSISDGARVAREIIRALQP
ncbi:MAG: FMN-binding protein [Campylobacterales bacterium]|nr:FMN-binding protein [Campylobacterales bacterium]